MTNPLFDMIAKNPKFQAFEEQLAALVATVERTEQKVDQLLAGKDEEGMG